jgi:hypothetical protein
MLRHVYAEVGLELARAAYYALAGLDKGHVVVAVVGAPALTVQVSLHSVITGQAG